MKRVIQYEPEMGKKTERLPGGGSRVVATVTKREGKEIGRKGVLDRTLALFEGEADNEDDQYEIDQNIIRYGYYMAEDKSFNAVKTRKVFKKKEDPAKEAEANENNLID